MPMSTDVSLPKGVEPTFPDRCVACGAEHPDGFYRAATHAIGWWTLAFWHFGPRFSVNVPSCHNCRGLIRRQKWIRLAVNAVFILIGVSVGYSALRWYHGPLKKWMVLVVALVCVLPVIFWELLFPGPIELTAYSATVDYEFRDSAYAHEFAALNGIELETEPD
jgi:hypothetical protein